MSAEQQSQDGDSLLSQILAATPQNPPEQERGDGAPADERLLGTMVGGIHEGTVTVQNDRVKRALEQIDALVSRQLSAILHSAEFQKLEGSWRGLHSLVHNTETSPLLTIRVLHCTRAELSRDLESADAFDQSVIWQKVYDDAFGVEDGQPLGALVGDYEFENHPADIKLLGGMSNVAAGAFCPFLTSPAPSLLKLKSWTELGGLRGLGTLMDTPEYLAWNRFRETPESRFVVMTLPRVLSRLPYGEHTTRVDELDYEEVPLSRDGKPLSLDPGQYCWMNAAYVLASHLANAWSRTGMCVEIQGRLSGAVAGLPTRVVRTEDGDWDRTCPTEAGITESREAELSKLGFLPLCHHKNEDVAVFFGAQTAHKPPRYHKPDATANAAISARLPFTMASSRFIHHLKILVRDRIDSFQGRQDLESCLDGWIRHYVNSDPNPNEETKARFPLREGRVEIKDLPGSPGSCHVVCHLRPWLPIEQLSASLALDIGEFFELPG